MEDLIIRKVNSKDISNVQELGKITFSETFSSFNCEEDLKLYLETGFSIQKLRTELSDINSEFYFAEIGDKQIGYLKFNFGDSQTEIKDENSLEIERIYVLKGYHGRKVGQTLYKKALKIARFRSLDFVWLGV